MKVAVIQGNIDQYKKWDNAYKDEIIDDYTALVKKASLSKPDLIIWPETAVPGLLPADPRLFSWVNRICQETATFHVIGAPYFNGGGAYYNASFLFGPDGEIIDWHKKIHLVPFGEFVPLRKLLSPFFSYLDTMGDFSPGDGVSLFSVKSVLWGPTICSENFFGGIVRRTALSGAEILLNQTNDAWFFRTSAAELHFTMNVFRAVENRRAVVVSANTGISGVIEPSGRISKRTELFRTDYFVTSVGPSKKMTFYTRWGNIFSYLCILSALFTLINNAFRRK
jgi:apolipoprotein N-acyltransferase